MSNETDKDKKTAVDTETILLTLDQIGQTIDIMTNVVGRLRGYITEQLGGAVEDKPRRHKTQTNSHTLH